MASKVTVFDHFMKPLTELDVPTVRTWALNDIGKCDIAISTSDPKCLEKYLQYGNLLHIQHIPTVDTYGTHGTLPDWTGLIYRGRVWDEGVLKFTAYSAESILTLRPMPYVAVKGTPLTIYQAIIREANALDTGINFQFGVQEDSSKQLSDDLRVSAYEHVAKLQKASGMYWDVTGDIDKNGNLILYANFRFDPGIKTLLDVNNNNSRLDSPLLKEEGTPMNVVHGYSQSSTARQRYHQIGINEKTLADYGYFGINMPMLGLHDPSSVLLAAQIHADIYGAPVKMTSRTALDFLTTFDNLKVGNIVHVTERNAGFNPRGGFGFDSDARILHMSYDDATNIVPLSLELI